MLNKYPPLQIHVWGGLGSQLFAVAATFEISKRFPNRELILVIHSSGVTKRKPEIYELFPQFKYLEVDDFTTRETHDSQVRYFSLRSMYRALLRNVAIFTGLLAEENNGRYRKVHKWTLSVRGHYFHRSVDKDFLMLLGKRLAEVAGINIKEFQQKTVLHYRLGDLLVLKNKSNIDPKRIVNVISGLTDKSEVTVFSDSPEKATSLLKAASLGANIVTEDFSSANAIWAASHAKTFIGTSSKISYWIYLLRLFHDKHSRNFMADEDKKIVSTISSGETHVQYY
jgi:hypothetical protein